MTRRTFIRQLAAFSLLIFGGVRFLFKPGKRGFIRPPGSVTENDFNTKCVKCGKCILVCPAKCLKPVPIEKGIVEWGTPHVIPREAGCIRCMNCSKVCPSSAIARVGRSSIKMGTAEINRDRCLVWKHNKDCLVCMEYCPVGAIDVDYQGRPVVNEDLCAGCGLCEENCPVKGESAIIVSNRGEKRYHIKERSYRETKS